MSVAKKDGSGKGELSGGNVLQRRCETERRLHVNVSEYLRGGGSGEDVHCPLRKERSPAICAVNDVDEVREIRSEWVEAGREDTSGRWHC